MIVIHIGSPKTGTTALQGVLKSNGRALASAGIRYVATGRSNISHNSMVQPLMRGKGADIVKELRGEIGASPGRVSVLSSEMFFQPGMAARLADAVGPLSEEVRIVGYIRRPDAYAEAMYKQKVKNGRIAPDPEQFLKDWHRNLRYMPTLSAWRDAFDAHSLHIRPFQRSHFPQGDVVADFVRHLGDLEPGDLERANTTSNKSLSRAVSEGLGRVNRYTPFNSRVMIREIAAAAVPLTLRSGDVYDKATRREILTACAEDLEEVQALCYPDLATPFDTADLEDAAPDIYPDEAEKTALERAASEAILAAIGRQANKSPT